MTFLLLLVCFFLSGFSALLYETAWTREFAFVFGTSELAVVAVLAAYMGGLALGAALAARWAPRIRRPVLAYGVLELAIALWAIALPYAIRGVRAVYLGWLGGLDALPETLGLAIHAFHLLGAFLVLVPCTALMGATLPLLARFAVTRDEEIGPRVGVLYAVNTAGAIGGTLAAAFVLLPALGLRTTVYVGAAINALVFAAAAALASRAPAAAPARALSAAGIPWILPAIAVSGAVSFGYEVLWFRLLGQLLGASTAAFSTMLASFLIGIALGSAIASRAARTPSGSALGFAAAQLATAAASWAAFRAADTLPGLAKSLDVSVNNLAPGALLAIAMLLPLTLCIGATFPFAVRCLARDAADASASSARVYAWNTVGSIAGAVGTGYFLLPWLGLEGTLVTGGCLNLALAALAAVAARPRRLAIAGAAIAAALALVLVPTPRPDALLHATPMGGGSYPGKFTYFAVGRSSTVALIDQGNGWRLTNNGLPESFIQPPDALTPRAPANWLSMLPVLLRPEIRHMVIIGLGAGMTVSAVPSTLETIDVIELEPEVVAANRAVPERAGGDPLADPRIALRLGDARGALTLSERRYDAIVSQPSHPWTSGASHLYTREFFQLAHSRLTPEGVFVQWIGASFVDPERLRSLLAALTGVFRHVEVYRPVDQALVMVASDAPFDVAKSAARAIAAAGADFEDEGIHRVEDVVAALAFDSDASREFADGAPPNSDDWNRLAMSDRPAGKGRSQWVAEVFPPRDPLPAFADRLDLAVLARRLYTEGYGARGRRLAEQLDRPRRELVLGWLAVDTQRLDRARQHFAAALDADPALRDAAIGLALVDPGADLTRLPDSAQVVIRARRAPDGLELARASEDRLAQWRPGDLLYPEAAELRVLWRLAVGSDAELREAYQILEPLVERVVLPRYLLYRAQVAARLGDSRIAWISLEALSASDRASPPVAAEAVDLAMKLGGPAESRSRVVQRLQRAMGGRLVPPPVGTPAQS